MCISVDLPEPDGPITATSLRALNGERDAAERVDGGLALAVAAGHVLGADDWRGSVHASETSDDGPARATGDVPDSPPSRRGGCRGARAS